MCGARCEARGRLAFVRRRSGRAHTIRSLDAHAERAATVVGRQRRRREHRRREMLLEQLLEVLAPIRAERRLEVGEPPQVAHLAVTLFVNTHFVPE